MARINIEECWWSDPRRTKLILKIGLLADAVAVNMWRVAQEFWKDGQRLVPGEVFDKLEHAADLIDCGLSDVRIEREPNGLERRSIYVRGSSERLEWVREQREQARKAGKKSAEARRKKTGTAQPKPKKPRTTTERPSNAPRTESNDAEPSGSGSISGSSSDSISGSGEDCAGLKEPQAPAAEALSPVARVWRAYKAAYEGRYHQEATWNAKVSGQLKQFVTRVPMSEAPEIAAFYLTHNGARYVSTGHAVGLLLIDAEKLRTEWRSGRKITALDARHADTGDALRNQIERLTKGPA